MARTASEAEAGPGRIRRANETLLLDAAEAVFAEAGFAGGADEHPTTRACAALRRASAPAGIDEAQREGPEAGFDAHLATLAPGDRQDIAAEIEPVLRVQQDLRTQRGLVQVGTAHVDLACPRHTSRGGDVDTRDAGEWGALLAQDHPVEHHVTAGGGQIQVFVEANGFAANLTLRTSGNRQSVQISSKGEIRGVNITMTKG